jgi:hypothetical protein
VCDGQRAAHVRRFQGSEHGDLCLDCAGVGEHRLVSRPRARDASRRLRLRWSVAHGDASDVADAADHVEPNANTNAVAHALANSIADTCANLTSHSLAHSIANTYANFTSHSIAHSSFVSASCSCHCDSVVSVLADFQQRRTGVG